jgi:hypothetical protein
VKALPAENIDFSVKHIGPEVGARLERAEFGAFWPDFCPLGLVDLFQLPLALAFHLALDLASPDVVEALRLLAVAAAWGLGEGEYR